jgi:hypothetical protein
MVSGRSEIEEILIGQIELQRREDFVSFKNTP